MARLPFGDIQGFAACGYGPTRFPVARFLLVELSRKLARNRALVTALVPYVTDAEWWPENGEPSTTLNVAFTAGAFRRLGLPQASLASFPSEFLEGMQRRAALLGDTGKNAPAGWEEVWRTRRAQVWIGVYACSDAALEERCHTLRSLLAAHEANVASTQDARALFADGGSTVEHFGYADGISNPSFKGDERGNRPGNGKLRNGGGWDPLATGEFLLGYRDESGDLPPAPLPHLLARNGTFMVYRKLRQDVAAFRAYMEDVGRRYPGGPEKLAAKFVGRWRDGAPLEPAAASNGRDRKASLNDFTYGGDTIGRYCPLGAHIRRANPRDSAGFRGRLVNAHRILRRGITYGPPAPDGAPVDGEERGLLFMAVNASLARQFEFVQQQWIGYGNDARQGNDQDPLVGNRESVARFTIQGRDDPHDPPYVCGKLPTFVELRGGDYFFMPSLTALRLIGAGSIDPR